MRIVKSIHFDAAHFLDDCPAREGAQVKDSAAFAVGKGERPYARLHGHSFTLEAAIEGEADPKTGWVADFADVAAALEEVRDSLDHRLLNEVEGLERPTLENICRYVAGRLKPRFPGLKQIKVARPSNGEACILDL